MKMNDTTVFKNKPLIWENSEPPIFFLGQLQKLTLYEPL